MTAYPFLLEDELQAVAETGLYESQESFLNAALETLLAARPDVKAAVAVRLYEKGLFSLGRTAEGSGLSIEEVKERLHDRDISREAPESLEETEAMARATLRAAGREPQSQVWR